MSLGLYRALQPPSPDHVPTGRDSEDSPEAMEEFKKSVKQKGFREENIFIPELQGEHWAAMAHAHANSTSLMAVCDPSCLGALFPFSPDSAVRHVLSHICGCLQMPLWVPTVSSVFPDPSVTWNFLHHVSLCPPYRSPSPVCSESLSPTSFFVFLVSVLPHQHLLDPGRVIRTQISAVGGSGVLCDESLSRTLSDHWAFLGLCRSL